jgi:hypothetical protein
VDEERLTAIETRINAAVPNDGLGWKPDGIHYYIFRRTHEERWATLRVLEEMFSDIPDLVAEVRRLQRENLLLNLSRGSPVHSENPIRHRDGDMPPLGSNGVRYETFVNQVGRD